MNKNLRDKCAYYLQTRDLSIFNDEERSTLHIWLQTDCAGAEALIVAYLCKDGDFRQLFINSIKPHVFVGAHLFSEIWRKKIREIGTLGDIKFDMDLILNSPIRELKSVPYWKELENLVKDSDNWSLEERYYYLAKQTCHSANYGITAEPFRMNILEKSGGKIVVSKAEADRFLITYHSLFPEIRDWHRRLRSQVEMTNIVYNLHGHPLTITWHEIPEQKWKEVIAIPPQSTVGMITNIAFSKLSNEYPQWDTLINGHDSVVSQCLIGEEIELVKAQKDAIEQEFISPVDGVKFRMKSETQIGFNLAPFKKGKDGQPDINILGLREIKI